MKAALYTRISILVFAAASLASCEKEDKLITLPAPGNAILSFSKHG